MAGCGRRGLGRNLDALAIFIAFLLYTAASSPPGVLTLRQPPEFAGWYDQGQYLRSASALIHGNLDPGAHWYPLLYPAFLAVFAWLPPFLATLIPDALCLGAAYLGFRAVMRRFGVAPLTAAILFLPSTLAYDRIADAWLIPWTTSLSAALIWGALAIGGEIMGVPDDGGAEASRPRERTHLLLGLILGAMPLCRPADLVVSGVMGLCLTHAMLIRGRQARDFGLILIGAAGAAGAGLMLHLAIYGPHLSDYMKISAAFGTNFRSLGWKAYIILVEPLPWYPYGEGLLRVLPWLPLGAAGLLVGVARRESRTPTLWLLLPALAYLAVMLAYTDLLPSGLWAYHNFHYFKWMIPLFTGFAWIFCRDFKARPQLSTAMLAVVLLASALHVMPVAAGPDAPARLVTFPDVPAPFSDVYFARTVLRDRRGYLLQGLDFHPVPDGHRLVLAEALRRDLAGDERWINPGDVVPWPDPVPRMAKVPPLPGTFPKVPIARYKPAVSLGWPCWLPPYVCPRQLP